MIATAAKVKYKIAGNPFPLSVSCSMCVPVLAIHRRDIRHDNVVVILCMLEQLLSHPWVKGEKAKDDQMDPEIVSRLQSFNARRKLRAAAIASVWSSTIFLRTKKLKSLVGSYDLKQEEIENLRLHFKKICGDGDNATLSEFEEVLKAMDMASLIPLAPRIFDLFDNNRDGTVDMREILCGFSSLKNSKGDDALRLCFQVTHFYSTHIHSSRRIVMNKIKSISEVISIKPEAHLKAQFELTSNLHEFSYKLMCILGELK